MIQCQKIIVFGGLVKQYKTKHVEQVEKKTSLIKDYIKQNYNVDLK